MAKQRKKHNPWEDHYSRKARKDRFPARSVYKLEEIQEKYHLLKKGDRVLDLGCAPGSWLLYAAKAVGSGGHVTGIDLNPVTINLPAHVSVHTGDIHHICEAGDTPLIDQAMDQSIGDGFQVVLSDMASATTGNKIVDSSRSFHLCQAALSIAKAKLETGGAFVCKIFQGGDSQDFSNAVDTVFNKRKIFKPKSSRKASKEIYIIGLGKR